MLICSSPQLIAAYHVLHRLLMPRHSPCALVRLTSSKLTSLLNLLCKFRLFRWLFLFPKSAFHWRFLGALLAFRLSVSRVNDLSFSLRSNYVSKLIGICCSSYPRISYIRAFFLKKPDFFLTLLFIQFSNINEHPKCSGGGKEIRTPDPLLARQVLSQLSYTPIEFIQGCFGGLKWTRTTDLSLIRRVL